MVFPLSRSSRPASSSSSSSSSSSDSDHSSRAGPSNDLPGPLGLLNEASSLLNRLNDGHGTFTPSSRPSTGSDHPSVSDGLGEDPEESQPAEAPSWRARLSRKIKSKKVRHSRALAREAGFESNKMM